MVSEKVISRLLKGSSEHGTSSHLEEATEYLLGEANRDEVRRQGIEFLTGRTTARKQEKSIAYQLLYGRS